MVKLEEGSGVEALCCFSPGLPCDAGGSWNTLAQGKGLEGKPEFRKGEAAVPYPALETKLPLTPPPPYSRVAPSSEVTCLSPKLQDKRGGAAKDGVSGIGWGSPLLLDRIASLWAEMWPQALPPPSAPIPPSVDTIGAVC